MNANSFLQAVFLPLTRLNVLVPLLVFCLLLLLVSAAGMFGIWLAVVVVPAVLRYQVFLLEAQAHGLEPEPPGIEFFTWTDKAWTLFPVVTVLALGWAAYASFNAAGTGAMFAVLTAGALVYPAQLGVLAITHSPLQSLNPGALVNFVRGCGPAYAIAPVYLLLVAWLMWLARDLNAFVSVFLEMFFVFSLHSVIGAIVRQAGLIDDVAIPDAMAPDEGRLQADLERNRVRALGHAYGFISRDNRQGGFAHLFGEIEKDPDTAAAWDWYLHRMFGWENQVHALFFAQDYVHDALAHGEDVRALKAVMRCRRVDDRFRPRREDVPALIEAAERTGNTELAEVLRRS
jgi:hypothetical protein